MKFAVTFATIIVAILAVPLTDEINNTEDLAPTFNIPEQTGLLIFTRDNVDEPQVVRWDDMSTVAASNFSPNRPTRIIVHGWQSNANVPLAPMRRAYLEQADVNVIVVDWSVGAGSINYITSRNHVPNVGIHLARFMDNIHAAGLIRDFSTTYCIGQSLGAHVCGFLGKSVTRGRINTIFGLDPAGPLFDEHNPLTRLARDDAEYVEVSHTDTVALGIGYPIGDADFFPNGGFNMPGCNTAVCDHALAAAYHIDSLRSDLMWGRQCESLAHMSANQCTGPGYSMGGEPSNYKRGVSGILRFNTNAQAPFGQGPF